MSDPYIGEVRMFAGDFAPQGWLSCNGQLVDISTYQTLYQLLGTTYGGDGQTTFGLPDLQGRAPVHVGSAPLLPTVVPGQRGGAETVTLTAAQLPQHTHQILGTSVPGTGSPAGNTWATARDQPYVPAAQATGTLAPPAMTYAGQSQPHDNMPPFTTVTFIIATDGVYPSNG